MMFITKRAVTALLVATFCVATAAAAETNSDGQWIQLFNGKDLTGWTPKIKGFPAGENYANTFRVENGVLVASAGNYEGPFHGRFGHLFYKTEYSDYILRVEYRLVGEQAPGGPAWAWANSGIMIHGQRPDTMAKDQDFPVSLEVQLLAGDGKSPRTTGNLCTPGTNVVYKGKLHTEHCTTSTSKTYLVGEWVACELEVHGDKLIRHKINGETVIEYSSPQLDERDPDAQALLKSGAKKAVAGGTISLQSESHPVEFRKVELKPLEPQ